MKLKWRRRRERMVPRPKRRMTARTSEAGDEMRAGPRGGEERAGMVSSISLYVRRREGWADGFSRTGYRCEAQAQAQAQAGREGREGVISERRARRFCRGLCKPEERHGCLLKYKRVCKP